MRKDCYRYSLMIIAMIYVCISCLLYWYSGYIRVNANSFWREIKEYLSLELGGYVYYNAIYSVMLNNILTILTLFFFVVLFPFRKKRIFPRNPYKPFSILFNLVTFPAVIYFMFAHWNYIVEIATPTMGKLKLMILYTITIIGIHLAFISEGWMFIDFVNRFLRFLLYCFSPKNIEIKQNVESVEIYDPFEKMSVKKRYLIYSLEFFAIGMIISLFIFR